MVTAQREGNAGLYNTDSLDAAVWEEKKYENMVKELAQANCPFMFSTPKSSGRTLPQQSHVRGISAAEDVPDIGGEYFPMSRIMRTAWPRSRT